MPIGLATSGHPSPDGRLAIRKADAFPADPALAE